MVFYWRLKNVFMVYMFGKLSQSITVYIICWERKNIDSYCGIFCHYLEAMCTTFSSKRKSFQNCTAKHHHQHSLNSVNLAGYESMYNSLNAFFCICVYHTLFPSISHVTLLQYSDLYYCTRCNLNLNILESKHWFGLNVKSYNIRTQFILFCNYCDVLPDLFHSRVVFFFFSFSTIVSMLAMYG